MFQKWVGVGRLTADPELRYTPNGTAVTTFTLAVDRSYQAGDKKVDFVNVICWSKLADIVANFLKKGRPAVVEGEWHQRSYDNKEGRKVYVWEVTANSVRFLPDGSGQGNQSREQPNGYDPFYDPFADTGKPINISDDDLPF